MIDENERSANELIHAACAVKERLAEVMVLRVGDSLTTGIERALDELEGWRECGYSREAIAGLRGWGEPHSIYALEKEMQCTVPSGHEVLYYCRRIESDVAKENEVRLDPATLAYGEEEAQMPAWLTMAEAVDNYNRALAESMADEQRAVDEIMKQPLGLDKKGNLTGHLANGTQVFTSKAVLDDLAEIVGQPCPDCKGSGQYVGLGMNAIEPCRKCGGSGRV